MNSDFPPPDPRAALEASLTALLVGELSHEEAAALHQKLAQDPELAQLYERLKQTINLVRETITTPAVEAAAQPEPLRLSEKRRQKLLAHFKTVKPREFARPRWREAKWLIPVAAAVAFVALLGLMLTPTLGIRGSRQIERLLSFAPSTADSSSGDSTLSQDAPDFLSAVRRRSAGQASHEEHDRAYHSMAAGYNSAALENVSPLRRSKSVAVNSSSAAIAANRGDDSRRAGAVGQNIILPSVTVLAAGAEGGWSSSSTSTFENSFGEATSPSGGGGGVGGQPNFKEYPMVGAAVQPTRKMQFASRDDLFDHLDQSGKSSTSQSGSSWTDNTHSKQGNVALAETAGDVNRTFAKDVVTGYVPSPPASATTTAIDPTTGLPLGYNVTTGGIPAPIDPSTGLPVPPPAVNPTTGLPAGAAPLDPTTGLPVAPPSSGAVTLNFGGGIGGGGGLGGGIGGGAFGGAGTTPKPGAAAASSASPAASPPVPIHYANPSDVGVVAAASEASANPAQPEVLDKAMEKDVLAARARVPSRGAGELKKGAERLTESLALPPVQTPKAGTFYAGGAYGAYSSATTPSAVEMPASANPASGAEGAPVIGALLGPVDIRARKLQERLPTPAPQEVAGNVVLPATTDFSAAATGGESQKYGWYYSGVTKADAASLAAQKPPLLGDTPKLGQLFSSAPGLQGGTAPANTGSSITMAVQPGAPPLVIHNTLDALGVQGEDVIRSGIMGLNRAKSAASEPNTTAVVGEDQAHFFAGSMGQEGKATELARRSPVAGTAGDSYFSVDPQTGRSMALADSTVNAAQLFSTLDQQRIGGPPSDGAKDSLSDRAGRPSPIFLPATPEGITADGEVGRDADRHEKLIITGVTTIPGKPRAELKPAQQMAEGASRTDTIEAGAARQTGRSPDAQDKAKAATLVHNGMLLYQMGKLDEAQVKLKEAEKLDPQNRPAHYYDNLISTGRGREALGQRDIASRSRLLAEDELQSQSAAKSQPYLEAKHKMEELERFGEVLGKKIASESADLTLPKSTAVEVVEKASPEHAQRPSLLGRLIGGASGQSESSARIRIERDQTDIPSSQGGRQAATYDPYFIQSEFEVLQSEAVLGKVIKELNLNQTWGKKQGGRTLSTRETMSLLRNKLDLRCEQKSGLVDVGVKSEQPEEGAKLANAIVEAYKDYRQGQRVALTRGGIAALEQGRADVEQKIAAAKKEVDRLQSAAPNQQADVTPPKAASSAPIPQPEVQAADNAFSTFSLNVSDVSFKLAAASLEKGVIPDPANVRSEEFINAFDYRDPEPAAGVPVAFAWERAQYPFAQNRDLLRFSIKTAAAGRQAGRPLNLVLLLDNSGSMERADRVQIIHEALRVLAGQLQAQDVFSVVTFSRTARLWVDGVSGIQATQVVEEVSGLTPQGGTNLEDAMNLAYQTALRHYLANGVNRVVLLTDGAANLGDVDPESLKQKVEANRKQGIALDCFGIGWEGYNDDLLEVLSRNGDGRYAFINTPEDARDDFAAKLAGALQVAASDVKVQVEFNPARVTAYRQMGYAKHQLTKEQFRDNTVNAAQIGAAEAGNALYMVEVNPNGTGPLCTVRVRFRIPGTQDYREHAWDVPFSGAAVALEQASPAMRLAATANAFSEWLVSSPYAAEVTPDRLLGLLNGVPEVYGADARPKKLEWMVRQAKSIAGK